jgi:hypothetical protein
MTFGQWKFAVPVMFCGAFCGAAERTVAPDVLEIGRIENRKITESSGVVASRQHPNVFWTHNDGGKSDTLFAISREGKNLAEFKVIGVKFEDWEDIAIDGEHHLYLSDTGDNHNNRKSVAVYMVDEPDPKKSVGIVRAIRHWQLQFPGGPVDCESLFVYRTNGYVVTKVTNDRKAELHRFSLATPAALQTLEFVTRLSIDSPVTGADIAPDGSAVALVAKSGAFVYRIKGDVERMGHHKPYHTRFKHEHIEGCTFVPEGLLATAESREIYLFTAEPFRVLK